MKYYSKNIMPTYSTLPIDLIRGEGVYVYDSDNNKYLDFAAGISVNILGYNNSELYRVLCEQGAKIWHVGNIFYSQKRQDFAEKLCNKSFADKVFFCNTGAEANESMIKAIRKYHYNIGNNHKNTIITFEGAFHGRTIATITASFKYNEGFEPLLPGFKKAYINDIESVKSLIDENTAGIILEPVQGEGGVIISNNSFLKQLRELCDKHGILLGFDEIQSGLGRTGELWCYNNSGVKPDLMVLAKGLGGGFPIGALLATNDACRGLTVGTHGTTFGGNPLAISIANKVFDIINRDGFLQNVRNVSEYIKQQLKDVDKIKEVRVKGLFIGLNFVDDIQNVDVFKACAEKGLLSVRARNNTLRLLPPLIIDKSHVDKAIIILKSVLHNM